MINKLIKYTFYLKGYLMMKLYILNKAEHFINLFRGKKVKDPKMFKLLLQIFKWEILRQNRILNKVIEI